MSNVRCCQLLLLQNLYVVSVGSNNVSGGKIIRWVIHCLLTLFTKCLEHIMDGNLDPITVSIKFRNYFLDVRFSTSVSADGTLY